MKYIAGTMLVVLLSACSTTKQIATPQSYDKMIEHHRMEYKQEFVKGTDSPLQEQDLKHMNFYPAEPIYNCDCQFERSVDAEPFDIQTYSGMTKEYIPYGTATCSIGGSTQVLTLYQSIRLMAMPMYRDYLFLPFMDETNGEGTYGGGRYIDLKVGDIAANGALNIDFNKCYNPYCAYSDGYNCPVPPPENHLAIPVKAGEKMYTGPKKKRTATH